jgi:ATP phosphoribosyltransferase
MTGKLILAIPSKGRLMEDAAATLARAGLVVQKTGSDRGYRGEVEGLHDIDVAFVSAAEIADQLRSGKVHLGITGEDLIREHVVAADERVDWLARLGFGHADVVVAVPRCWLDVATMSDLREMAQGFRRRHERRLRVATKYMKLTRGFFKQRGVADYLVVESLGATEGTPASGTADLIVDITSTGSTLRANGLKVLSDGLILRSEANLILSKCAPWSDATRALTADIVMRLGKAGIEVTQASPR